MKCFGFDSWMQSGISILTQSNHEVIARITHGEDGVLSPEQPLNYFSVPDSAELRMATHIIGPDVRQSGETEVARQ